MSDNNFITSKCVLVLGRSLHDAQMLLRELAEVNREEVVRYRRDCIIFADGYTFVARSIADFEKIIGLNYSQVIFQPFCISEMVHHYLSHTMMKYGVPPEFQWIPISF